MKIGLKKSFKVSLDRVKEDTAVLLVRDEEKVKINIPLFLLPACKEGDVLGITIGKDVQKTGGCEGESFELT